MARINIQPDCGNAPRKVFLKDFNVALAKGDKPFLKKNIHDGINWEVAGHINVTGKEDYLKAIIEHKFWKVKELTIDAIITHGLDASVSGRIMTSDNTKFTFCDIYRFKGASGTTINSIKTFLIEET
jgi:ribosomal protein S4E